MATFAIDPAHTDVLFSAKHMMVTTVRGTFTDVSGSIDIDEADPTASKAEITVQAASVDTGFGARDTHLRSRRLLRRRDLPGDPRRVDEDPPEGRQRLRRHRRRHDQRHHQAGRLRCRVPGLLHRAWTARGVPASPPRPRSIARTGASTGTSPSRPAAGWSATRSSSRSRSPSSQESPSPPRPHVDRIEAPRSPGRFDYASGRRVARRPRAPRYPAGDDDHRSPVRRPEHDRAAARRPGEAARPGVRRRVRRPGAWLPPPGRPRPRAARARRVRRVARVARPAGPCPRDRARDAGPRLHLRPAAGDRPRRDPAPLGQAEPAAEPAALEAWTTAPGIPTLGRIEAPGTIEGGDTFWLRPDLFCIGRSLRTNADGARQLAALVGGDVRIFDVPYWRGPAE